MGLLDVLVVACDECQCQGASVYGLRIVDSEIDDDYGKGRAGDSLYHSRRVTCHVRRVTKRVP